MLSTNLELVLNEMASFPPANGNYGHFECFNKKITQKYKKGLDKKRGQNILRKVKYITDIFLK